MKLDTELVECEAEVAELRSQLHKVTKLLRQLVAAHRSGNQEEIQGLSLLAEDV